MLKIGENVDEKMQERERERPFLQIGFHRLGMKPVQLKEIEAISFFLKMRDMKEMEPC